MASKHCLPKGPLTLACRGDGRRLSLDVQHFLPPALIAPSHRHPLRRSRRAAECVYSYGPGRSCASRFESRGSAPGLLQLRAAAPEEIGSCGAGRDNRLWHKFVGRQERQAGTLGSCAVAEFSQCSCGPTKSSRRCASCSPHESRSRLPTPRGGQACARSPCRRPSRLFQTDLPSRLAVAEPSRSRARDS